MKKNKKMIIGILIILMLTCILISILLIGEITSRQKDKRHYSIFFGNNIDNNIENRTDNNTISNNTNNNRNDNRNNNIGDNTHEDINSTNSVTTNNNGSQNNNSGNNGDNNNNNNNDDNNNNQDNEPEYDKIILVKSEDKIWRENTELNIFANKEFNNQNIIAPESTGQYKFIIENKNKDGSPILCNIEYSEINDKNINMVYKIKINGEYIDDAQWKKIDEFKIENLEIKDNVTCTLEWRWADAPNDTEIGESSYADYKLGISITGIAN